MSVRILVGDARERISEVGHADVVITDPVWPNCPAGLLAGSEQPVDLLAAVLDNVPESTKRIVVVLRSDSDPRFLSAVPDRWPFFSASWLQYVMPGYYGRLLGGNEIAYAFGEPVKSQAGRRVIPSMAPKAQPHGKQNHPCPRSETHMDWLVKWWSDKGETILDPFAGIGTIGLAAERRGRDAVLIEIDAEYAAIAEERIRNDAPMFPSAVQMDLAV